MVLLNYFPDASWRSRALSTLLTAVMVWLLGFLVFMVQIPSPPSKDVPLVVDHADAIVVLTGGSGRVEQGLRLLLQGKSNVLFISGVGERATVAELARSLGITIDFAMLHASGKRIALGHEATDTIGNAIETAAWVKEEGIEALVLVTSNYHMPRSLMEFHHLMPEVKVIPAPVFPARVKLEGWVDAPGSARLILAEYHKYLLRALYFVVEPLIGGEIRLIPKSELQEEAAS